MRRIWAKRGNYLQSGASEARCGALKHGTRARRWFWTGWVCFNGGVRVALKHGARALRRFWTRQVCFNGGEKEALKHGTMPLRALWTGWVCFKQSEWWR